MQTIQLDDVYIIAQVEAMHFNGLWNACKVALLQFLLLCRHMQRATIILVLSNAHILIIHMMQLTNVYLHVQIHISITFKIINVNYVLLVVHLAQPLLIAFPVN